MIHNDMSATLPISRAVIIIKALPRPSSKYGETVCCAGITASREWKRLYPVRFRQLTSGRSFRRWDWVEFAHRPPTTDRRRESCHVFEDAIKVVGTLPENDRFALLDPMVTPSASAAASSGASLALIRPSNPRFRWRRKSEAQLEAERREYREAGRQQSLLDADLAAFEPTPFAFAFTFRDAEGPHTWTCGDWETHATFFYWRKRYGEASALERLGGRFNDEYPAKGMLFATGNMMKRPKTWQLLGVVRLDEKGQLGLL
ncbi:hypothetical protein GGQ86_000490 [Xanthobacter flavus]|uniref:Uncharacterized protein n=1 Tax=Xanthobacter flavus TaxID=281 RepID=A0ABU1KB36_XANFL|nr:hypothetical protein [Xanthobacter flavus]MDR6332043.1 hypothetical protein [Xanthobacter flavus]